jgi:hypothetical protein
MFYSGKRFRASRDKANNYSNSRVVRKQISERNKKPYPHPTPCKLNGRSLYKTLAPVCLSTGVQKWNIIPIVQLMTISEILYF